MYISGKSVICENLFSSNYSNVTNSNFSNPPLAKQEPISQNLVQKMQSNPNKQNLQQGSTFEKHTQQNYALKSCSSQFGNKQLGILKQIDQNVSRDTQQSSLDRLDTARHYDRVIQRNAVVNQKSEFYEHKPNQVANQMNEESNLLSQLASHCFAALKNQKKREKKQKQDLINYNRFNIHKREFNAKASRESSKENFKGAPSNHVRSNLSRKQRSESSNSQKNQSLGRSNKKITVGILMQQNGSLQKNGNDQNSMNKMQQQENIHTKQIRNTLKEITNIKVRHTKNSSQDIRNNQHIQFKKVMSQQETQKISSPQKEENLISQERLENPLIKEPFIALQTISPRVFTNEYFCSLVKQQLNLTKPLARHQITDPIRQKMIDWMIEVVVFVFTKPNISAFFKTINLMDLFLKKSQKKFQDSDIHLIGVCCLIISNHFEQRVEVGLNHFCREIAHQAFEKKDIINMKMHILQTIDYDLNFSTVADFNNQYIAFLKKYQKLGNQFLQQLTELSYYYILQSHYFQEQLSYQPRIISLASIFVALEFLINNSKDTIQVIDTQLSSIQKALLGEFSYEMDPLMTSLAFCIKNVKMIHQNFEQINPKLFNYRDKFQKFILN
ncbi:amine-terminal domain cyclin (macronuclear) [Tetrahymena thermophila SB210]|uniref:Amine-terminal domain cyclin n=1 Tax=Tetrahymena thermophila (strain SB210) TaxID=312017 RepID=Q23FR2_TETTS|nr:amine-terminal domain cyclin [Tetrahymena thermophila SB210]EAR95548.1 amine-terminal domain cyclin [Tetrahymena thermophila SB210]|eukprot:XP_001015793.1 amine-terminal domain cyclin [Tetrahymena thermophila SB210]